MGGWGIDQISKDTNKKGLQKGEGDGYGYMEVVTQGDRSRYGQRIAKGHDVEFEGGGAREGRGKLLRQSQVRKRQAT